MGAFENPVIRLFFILAGGFTLASLYVMFTGYLPGSLQWFPFGVYPSIGSLPYIALFVVGTAISGGLWWYATWIMGRRAKKDLMQRLEIRVR
jgi:hypothetical protein